MTKTGHTETGHTETGHTETGRRPAGFTVRPMTGADAVQVLAIYQAGLDGDEASFETQAPAWEVFDATRLPGHRHVAVDDAGGGVLRRRLRGIGPVRVPGGGRGLGL